MVIFHKTILKVKNVRTRAVEKIKSHFVLNNIFFRNRTVTAIMRKGGRGGLVGYRSKLAQGPITAKYSTGEQHLII